MPWRTGRRRCIAISSTAILISSSFFQQATPIDEIARLQLGIAPARRTGSTRIEDFRAIPWVFSWTQIRVILPGWYGLGIGTGAMGREFGIELSCKKWNRDWPFFTAILSNAELALAKADPRSPSATSSIVEPPEMRDRIWGQIAPNTTARQR